MGFLLPDHDRYSEMDVNNNQKFLVARLEKRCLILMNKTSNDDTSVNASSRRKRSSYRYSASPLGIGSAGHFDGSRPRQVTV